MSVYRVQYTISEVYEVLVSADSEIEAFSIVESNECDSGTRIDSWLDSIDFVDFVEE